MKFTYTLLAALLFAAFSPAFAMQNDKTNTDFVVADNIIEAINEIDIISLNVLLAEGADVDTLDKEGNTPLMLAAKIGNPRMIDIILAHNPEIDRRNNDGNTALMIASANGVLSIVEDLKNSGADGNLRNKDGLTPAQIALRNGHADISSYLNDAVDTVISR
ncbi:MAG: ankyrin repeat domain-containing protein [Balneolaceae bacterium]